jgi:hypothetical protein
MGPARVGGDGGHLGAVERISGNADDGAGGGVRTHCGRRDHVEPEVTIDSNRMDG